MNVSESSEHVAAEPLDLIHRIAQLTRVLREGMRELGLDQAIKDAA
ncbi:MAG: protein phosphatase CheZ, partial [Paralcaligenes sp.]